MIKQENVFRRPGYWDGSNMPHKFITKTSDTGENIRVRDNDYPSIPDYTDEVPKKKKSIKEKIKKVFSNDKKKYVLLSVCGYCKTDTKDDYQNRTEKVIEYDFANMLCGDCRRKMRNEMVLIAIKYLQNN